MKKTDKKINWQIKDFEDCLDKIIYTKKIQRKSFLSSGKLPIISQEAEFINGYWDDEKDLFKVKKPVSIFGDHTQVVKYVDFDFVLGADGVKIFQPKDFLDSKFFYYFLQSISLKNLGYARHYRLLKECVVSYPPLPEQKRIVKILDEVFGDVKKAKENAEKNLANAKELFESYLQGVFENPGKDWEEKKLGEIANVEYGYTDKARDVGGFRFVRITDIDNNGNLESKNKKYIKFSKEAEKFVLTNNDLLMARTGATFAKVLLYKNEEPSVFASYLIRIKFNSNIDNNLYWYFSKSKKYWSQAITLSSGSAQPQFNGNALKELFFSFPRSLAAQKQIVKKLDELSVQTKKLEAVYRQKLADLEEFKKSILKKAFDGEL